ncbi:MAG: cation:proton antiporter [Candidatus Nanopelagicales bacterium]
MSLTQYVALAVICAIAYAAGELGARVHVPRLPVYLGVGALASVVVADVRGGAQLAFPKVSTVSLAFIGFVAGSHLVWKVVQPRLKPIVAQVLGMTLVVPLVVGVAVYLLIPQDESDVRIAAALLAGTVMLALSPPEAIAVIGESRSEGPFTRLVLGSTVVMDVVVVSTFSVTLLIAEGLVGEGTSTSELAISVAAVLGLALLGGIIVGILLRTVIERGLPDLWVGVLVVVVAGIDAALAPTFTAWADDVLGVNIEIDSLLIAMIAGVIVANWTKQPERFERILERMVPWVYVIFFTLTGLGLHLEAIVAAAGAAAVLWILRLTGLFVGSTAAMSIVKEPAVVRRVAWRAYMPQAGIALALAATIASDFPEGGEQLSTVIIAVVVLNEATGPFFLRSALRATGEVPEKQKELLD